MDDEKKAWLKELFQKKDEADLVYMQLQENPVKAGEPGAAEWAVRSALAGRDMQAATDDLWRELHLLSDDELRQFLLEIKV